MTNDVPPRDRSATIRSRLPAGALARLQQSIVAALALMALAWWWMLEATSTAWAWAGVFVCAFGYTGLLAAELILMQRVNRADPSPQASSRELLVAWARESWVVAQVFGWRQPFRANAVPDQLADPSLRGQRGVVFVHGLVCNRGFWTPWLERLQGKQHPFAAVSLEPVFGSIAGYSPLIDAAVKAITQASGGLAPLMVCHSMGGLAARAWLASHVRAGDPAPVYRIVTIGSPHRGTWLARFGHTANTLDMRQDSAWLARLNADQLSQTALFTCWFSNCDHIVFPASTATLPGADNRMVHGVGHVQLAFVPEVIDTTLALLEPDACKAA